MIRLDLVGYPLSHSLSPELHVAAFDAFDLEDEYRLCQVAPGDMNGLSEQAKGIRAGELQGLNVTIPHKQAVIHLLDQLTPSARAIGAVNTLCFRDGRLIGRNTDASGFKIDHAKLIADEISDKNDLVLGTGEVARAIVYALLEDDWKVTLACRRQDIYEAIVLIESFSKQDSSTLMKSVLMEVEYMSQIVKGLRLIVNVTSVGMAPETEFSPWPVGLLFLKEAAIYDVIYNLRQTRLVQDARAAGLQAITGLVMLVEQAALSFACWTGWNVPREIMFSPVEAKC